MATKRKKPAQTKKVTGKKKKKMARKVVVKRPAAKTKKRLSAKQTVVQKKAAISAKGSSKKKKAAKAKSSPKRRTQPKGRRVESTVVRPPENRARIGGQSGDLQGLSDIRSANSESVDELLEEGNAFEADVVKGVEEAGNEPEREVHTHEVLEDDVPEEYLDQD